MRVIEGGFNKEEEEKGLTLNEHLDNVLEASGMQDEEGVRFIIILENEERHTIVSNYSHVPDASWSLDCAKHYLLSGVTGE